MEKEVYFFNIFYYTLQTNFMYNFIFYVICITGVTLSFGSLEYS